jgi:sulfur carrier protein ThiS
MNHREHGLTAVLFVLLVSTAGCAGLGLGEDPSERDAPTTPPPAESTPPPTTAPPTDRGSEAPTGTAAANRSDAAATGTLAVVVDGERIDLSEAVAGTENFSVDDDHPDTWHANGTPTLAAALSTAGVDVDLDSLSYDGETYADRRNGTTISYRVDGEPVNPTRYELTDDDEVWVLVFTDETDAPTPGEYIPPDRLHAHGTMAVEVNGQPLDVGRDERTAATHDSHFHFEGGHGQRWHANSWSVTLAYALSTLEAVEVDGEGITYAGTTYAADDADAPVTVTVNGDPVDPTDYYLKDGDSIRVEIRTDG